MFCYQVLMAHNQLTIPPPTYGRYNCELRPPSWNRTTVTKIRYKQKISNLDAFNSLRNARKFNMCITFLPFHVKQRAVVMNDGKTYPKSSTHSPPLVRLLSWWTYNKLAQKHLVHEMIAYYMYLTILSPQTLPTLGNTLYGQKSNMAAIEIKKLSQLLSKWRNVACNMSFSIFSGSGSSMVTSENTSAVILAR